MTHTDTDRRRWTAFGVGVLAVAGLAAVRGTPADAPQMPTGPAARDHLALACAPRAVRALPAPLGHVVGSTEPKKMMFGPGDRLVVSNPEGSLSPGEVYFVRRTLAPDDRGVPQTDPWVNLHTVGWIRIESVEADRAIASIVYACDSIDPDDYLVPFEVPVPPTPLEESGEPDFETPGRLLFGTERRGVVGGGSFVVIDRGTDHGLRLGQRVTFFRRDGGATGPIVILGDGLVVIVQAESATVRIDTATQPIYGDDAVAVRR